ncbi:MAG: methylated-DNA--[protein]-cysteine S-methyltransferase [Gammaproteobacteria bacterium]|nr:methylated-DNA--[protein]-cysteine S-methyltransferase [Gammaproteobacteria bacterium]MDH3469359.1 methylated-DNA--[protein]-cysteine S-methyltransferase [Gammaproteobacteria bacterium]
MTISKQSNTPTDNGTTDYQRIEQAIRYLDGHFKEQPPLREVARAVDLSEYHFQRLFRRWAGISPKRFVQYLTARYTRALLEESTTTLDATYAGGLSSPSRLHELFINVYAMSPAQRKCGGAGMTIQYGIHRCPFGLCVIGMTDKGICWLSFVHDGESRPAVHELQEEWPNARFVTDKSATATTVNHIFRGTDTATRFTLDLKGTNFQIQVWRALLELPLGAIVSYQELARRAGCARSTRAVASAVARNPVAYLIPCHRVIRSTGVIGNYRWGATRKQAMLGWEAARVDDVP